MEQTGYVSVSQPTGVMPYPPVTTGAEDKLVKLELVPVDCILRVAFTKNSAFKDSTLPGGGGARL